MSRLMRFVPVLSAQQVRFSAWGALLLIASGTLWLGVGLYASEHWTLVTVLGVLALAGALAVVARHLLQQAARLPRGAEDIRAPWIFAWTNAAQWSAMVLLAVQLHLLHLDRYDASAMAAIMALHLFVLAQLHRSWVLHLTGATLLLWIISALLLNPWHPAAATALGTGLIFWLLTAVILTPLLVALPLARLRMPTTRSATRCSAASRWGRPEAASTQVIVIPNQHGLGARARQKANAAHARRMDDEKAKMYAELVVNTMPAIAREALLKADVSEHEVRRDSVRRYRAEGGQQAIARLVLRLLTIRFRELPHEVTRCVQAASEDELVAVAERLLAAATLQQALGEPLTSRSELLRTVQSNTQSADQSNNQSSGA